MSTSGAAEAYSSELLAACAYAMGFVMLICMQIVCIVHIVTAIPSKRRGGGGSPFTHNFLII
jgi:hypothetical protein